MSALILNLIVTFTCFFFLPVLSIWFLYLIDHSTQIRYKARKREASIDFIENCVLHELKDQNIRIRVMGHWCFWNWPTMFLKLEKARNFIDI